MNWLLEHKEVITMIANIAVAGGFGISFILIIINLISLKRMKRTYQADLFFKLTSNIDAILREQADREQQGPKYVENWYERLLNAFEDFGYFANRRMISKEMVEHYVPSIIAYCKEAPKYSSDLKKKLGKRTGEQFSEIIKIYEKRTNKKIPF